MERGLHQSQAQSRRVLEHGGGQEAVGEQMCEVVSFGERGEFAGVAECAGRERSWRKETPAKVTGGLMGWKPMPRWGSIARHMRVGVFAGQGDSEVGGGLVQGGEAGGEGGGGGYADARRAGGFSDHLRRDDGDADACESARASGDSNDSQVAGYNTCGSRTTLDTGGQVIVLRSGRRYRFGAEFVPTARRTLPAGERDAQHRRAQPRRRKRTGVAGFDGEGKIPIARLEGGGGHAATLA